MAHRDLARRSGRVELVLEPRRSRQLGVHHKALYNAGVPATAFVTSDIRGEVERLTAAGVRFRGAPVDMGSVAAVVFDDTCSNLIKMIQPAV